ncbi:hypothetical protein AC057_10090 [Acinetobacter genomosp. 33YU]|uniref:hypothetical protein n=1 Tax=Acinetobacter genomosp. 33YU TaxID=1675530 RepID=UPI00097F8521|nr:hypothetical protein [Acinetobacter genomosp. 33YU]ONN57073.1 hypothetical protein AC057_10090 [Acinetobacter genomosp. 33YU]
MSSKVQPPYPLFHDIDGRPLDAGYIYIGEAGKNPEVYPIPVFWDENLTVPAEQPIRTRNGFFAKNGRAGKIYVSNADCSITVKNKKKVVVSTDLFSDLFFDQKNMVTTVESIADLNNLDKWDGRTIYVKNIGTYTYSNEKWKLKSKDFDYTPLSVLMGSIDDNQDVSSVIKALPDGSNVLIDLNCNIADVDISAKNINLKGMQAKWMKLTGVKGLQLNGSNCNVDELYIDTNGKSYGIVESGIDNTIQNVKFKGDVGHYIISMGVRPKVLKCEHAKGYSQITPFVFSGATDFLIEKCLLDEYTGFGIQARWCDGGRMKDNISNALFTTKTVKTTSSKTYTIDLGRQHSRFGVTVTNASNEEIPVPFNISNSGNIYTVTLDNTPASDRTLKLYATDALESYQVNSGCVDVVVQDNT